MKKPFKTVFIFLLIFAAALLYGCNERNLPSEGETDVPFIDFMGPFSIKEGGMSFYFDIRENGVDVYEEANLDATYQSFPSIGTYDKTLAEDGFIFEDLNFDGYCDFAFPRAKKDGVSYFCIYFWEDDIKMFGFCDELLDICDIETGDGYLRGYEVHGGTREPVNYYFENGVITEEHTHDLRAEAAVEYAEAFLNKDGLRAEFVRNELVANNLCKLYFIYDGDVTDAYIAVNYDASRIFYSDKSDVYFELISKDGGYKKSPESYGRMNYSGIVHTYVAEGYESIDDAARNIYGSAEAKISNFENVEYKSAEARGALEALMADNPLFYSYFRYSVDGDELKGEYFYSWAPDTFDISKEELERLTREYTDFTDRIVSEMPRGLEPVEKYIYLIQALQFEMKEGDEPKTGFLIGGDTEGERLARTFQLLCKNAELYCACDGEVNTILTDGEKKTVKLYDIFRLTPGSDEWQEEFNK